MLCFFVYVWSVFGFQPYCTPVPVYQAPTYQAAPEGEQWIPSPFATGQPTDTRRDPNFVYFPPCQFINPNVSVCP